MLAWTEALYESDEEQREEGITVNKKMILRADIVAFYIDFGMSSGMTRAFTWASMHGKKTVRRTIYK